MARPREFDPDTAVAAAMETFWARGYANTSIQDLVEHLGLNRGSIYATFGSKHDLFVAALDRYCAEAPIPLLEALEGDGPLLERLRVALVTMVDADFTDPDRKGCLLVNSAMETLPRDEITRERFEQAAQELQNAFATAIRRAQREGELGAHIDPDDAGVFLITTLQGLRVMAKATSRREPVVAAIDVALRALI